MPKNELIQRGMKQVHKHLITLMLTHDCNLRCKYCYEPNKNRDYMSFEIAQNAIKKYMTAENEFDAVEFDLIGGEPMLAFPLIRDLVDWFHTQEWKKKHLFFLGTNGTILTDEMKSWLIKNKTCVYLGISLDGNKIAHDLCRSKSYDRVMKNMSFFLEHWGDQPVKMTITAETISFVADSIIDLEEKEIPFSANIVFEDIWGDSQHKTELLEIYAKQLDRLVEYYVNHSDLVPARIVNVPLEFSSPEFHSQEFENDCTRWCGSGHEMAVVETDGSVYPCHRFCPWVTGKPLPDPLVNRQKSWKPEKCASCKWNNICATCVGYNWQVNGDCQVRTTYHCEAFKLELRASAKLQALRFLNKKKNKLIRLTPDEIYKNKVRIDSLLDIAANGI